MIKILNLYAGIGGNRKLWPDDEIEVTAVENNPEIAKIYQDFFPNDNVIVVDAHDYLLHHYEDYDFIWSSPPCPTHSRMNFLSNVQEGKTIKYPDMRLYQEVIFLQNWFKGKWVVENVIGYYEPLIKAKRSGNHYFWSNFHIPSIRPVDRQIRNEVLSEKWGFDLWKHDIPKRMKDKLLNNLVYPLLGLHIFNCAFKEKQVKLTEVK